MDRAEIYKRQMEGMRLAKELGPVEYAKIKAAKRKVYRDGLIENAKAILGDQYHGIDIVLPPKIEKKRGCAIAMTISDEGGECSFVWQAPNLMGTVMPSHRNKDTYMAKIKPLLEQVVGKLK